MQIVPRVALQIENCVNCDYTNQIANCKNCYLTFSAEDNEDCYYSYRILNSKGVTDALLSFHNQNSYELLEGRDSSNVSFSRYIVDSFDISFCYDMAGCHTSFMSSNKHSGSYYFFNEQLSKEEYQKRMKEIDTGSHKNLEEYKEKFRDMYDASIHHFAVLNNAINSSGKTLRNVKNAYYSFYGSDLENCRYMFFANGAKDGMDVNIGEGAELVYETCTTGLKASNIKFSIDAWPEVRNLEYCDCCRSGSSDLFGCISLRNKQYCILNKQYSKEEYGELVSKIKDQMSKIEYVDRRGIIYRYGEFFPVELSFHAYNETMAYDWFPLSKQETLEKGWRWEDEERVAVIDIASAQLPDHIRDIDESIIGKTVGCAHGGVCNQKCTVGFRITPYELQIYKSKNIALPRICPNCRHYERLRQLPRYEIYDRQCSCDYVVHANTMKHSNHASERCQNIFKTAYSPDRPEILYCKECYQEEIF